MVHRFFNKQVDGICLAPLDADALLRPVREATRGGIPVVVFGSGLNGEKDEFASFVATDNFRGGQLAAQTLGKSLDASTAMVQSPSPRKAHRDHSARSCSYGLSVCRSDR